MHVEPLEDRSMLAVLVVDPSNLADYATINLAMAAANNGDTINVVAGTFSENVNVNKSVTIEGAQAGVDARTRSGAETIVTGVGNSGKTPFYITASDVTIDGFTIEGATDSNQFGFGVLIGGGTSGAHILNNIVDNNIVGLSLANANPADPAVIQHNVFANNNQPGPASGTGIYSDQFNAGGTLSGVQIDGNNFTGNADAGIDFSSTDGTKPATGVAISNNDFNGNARGIVAFNLTSSSITTNTFENSTSSATADIRLFEGVDGLSITNNLMKDGAGKVLRVSNIGTGSPDATNITFNGNSVSGYTGPASLFQVDNYAGTLDARFNWWGTNNDVAINGLISNPAIVGFSPYLDNGNNSAVGTGFVGDFSHLDVTPLGFQFGAVGPIEAAILAAAPGATVTVNAGTYIEDDVVITQGIQLIANGAVTIQSPTAGSGTGVTINAGAANVTLEGFTLTGFATGIGATSANSLLLKDDTLTGNTAGGSISGVAGLNVTSTSGVGQLVVLTGGSPSSNLVFAGQDAISYTGLTNLAINTGSGSNFLKVDFSAGNPIPSGGLSYNGGSGASSGMLLGGGSFSNEVYTPSGAHAGTIQFDSSTLTYSGLAPIQDLSNATTITINGTAAGEHLNVVDGPTVGGFQTTEVNSGASGTFELVDFANKTFAVVNGAGGADTVVVNNPNVGAGLTSLALTVNGAGSTVAVNAAGTPVSVNNLAAGSATATVTVGNGTLNGIADDVTVSGAAGSTALIINDNADGVLRHATVTSSQTSGLASSGAAVKYTAADLSSFTVNGGTGSDTYNVTSTPAGIANAINATAGNTIFNITGSGLGTGSTNDFSETALTFTDTFNVNGPLNAPASISGSPASSGNVLNYDAGGNSVVLTANSITAGAGQTLTFSNIADVNITDVAGVTVNGDGNANNLVLTRTGATTDAYTLDGGPTVTFAGASSFAFNGLGGADSLSVDNSGGLIDIPISFAGGAGFDSLFVSGDAGLNVSAVYSQTGSDATGFAGSIVYTGTVTEAINFTGLSPVETLTPVTSLTINDAPGATVENIITGPTSIGIDPFLATTATTYQVNYGGAGEPINWRNATTVTVNGSNLSDTITENLPTRVDAGSPNQLTTLNVNSGGGTDEIDVLATPAGVATNTNTEIGVPDRTVIGGTFATFNNGTGSTAAILGPVNVSDSGGVGQLYVDDSGGAGPDVVTLTNSSIVGASPATIGYDATMTAVQIALTAHDDTVDVQSTQSGAAAGNNTVTTLFGNGGNDTFNVSSAAPAMSGDLNGIQGELDIASGAGNNDSLNVSDYGGVGRNYTLASPGAGVTQLSATGIANIVYNSNGGFQLENFKLVGAAVGGNTYNVLNTTATLSNIVSDGNASGSGNSTFNIQANQLQAGASNSFNGFAGDDTFNLNLAAGTSVPSAAGTTLSIDGGGLATGNDRVNVNANQVGDGPRTVGLNYQSNATSSVQIAGLGTAAGAIGVIGARQVNYYGDAANNDTVSVSGAASGNNTLSVTPLSASSANVFLGGNPLLTIPPGSTGSNNPGVLGGGAGPDLYIGGVALAGFSVNGGSTGAGNGNRLVVNGKSENLNGAGGTSAWGGNAFGSPADTVAAGNGYDQIDVSDSKVSIVNNAVGALLAVNYTTNSFANPSPTQAAVTVNGGDETAPAAGVADDFTVHLSPAIHFQINGGAPPAGSAPNGDRLNVLTPNDAEIWSDAATPPNVSVTSSGSLPASYNSIEELSLTPGNGIVNIYGDNNVSGGAQNDGYRVVGTGPNAFTLQITGDKNNPASYSSPIQISGVTTLNAYGEAKGVDNTGNDINALYVTPWANNTPQGWGVQTFWDQGDKNHDGDLLVYNGVAGVSENINVQPSASQAGQLFSTNAATGTPIAVINYVLNTDLVVNGNDGSAGDTDTLTLYGTDPANPGASGQDNFIANFAAAGTPAAPMVTVTDNVGGAALYTLDNFTNINTLNVKMLGGSDFFNLISGRNDGSLTVNVDGGAPSGPGNFLNTDGVQVTGTAGSDTFRVSPGASNDAGRVTVQLAGATAPTVLNYTTTENVAISGGGGPDSVTLDGTGSSDSFALANGTAQINSGAPISLSGFGPGSSLNLNGLGGANSFAIDQATGAAFANVNINGGPAGNGAAAISGTNGDDAINFTPISANSGQITVNSGAVTHYNLTGITSASIDALGQTTGDSLNVATGGTFVNTPGSQPGSGTVQVTLPGNIATLPLSYANVESVSFSGTTLVINGTSGNDNVAVAADGSVTVNGNPVNTTGFTALVLNLQGGADNVSIAAGSNFPGGIVVNGAGQTNVTVTGTAGNDTIGVDAATGQVTGIVSGPIMLVGVQNLTVNGGGAAAGDAISVINLGVPGGLQSINVAGNGAAGDTLQVSGSGGPDNMLVTPTGATSGMLQDSGVGPVVNYSAFSAAGALQVTANALTVNGSAGDDNITVTNGRVTVAGDLPVNYNTSATALNIMGLGGSNSLTVDSTTGAVTTPIYYDGGAGSNSLTLTGGTATSDIYSPGAATGQGLNTLVIGGQTESVHFVNLAPVIDNVAGPLVVNGTNGDDAINYSADPNNAGNGLVSVNNLETISFVNKTSLTINAGAGNDTININNPNTPSGLGSITVNGGDPTAGGDTLVVNGRVNTADTITYTPATTTSDTGSVAITGLPTVNFSTTEHLVINGQNGGPGSAGDSLTIATSNLSTNQTEILTPGTTFDSGHVDFRDRPGLVNPTAVPVDFLALGVAGSLSFTDVGRFDNLIYNGTNLNDNFTVNNAGQVVLNSQIPVNTASIRTLTLAGLAGDDTFNVRGDHNLQGIAIESGDPSANDTLNFTGDGTAPVTIDLTARTVTETGFGPVSYSGVGSLNVNAGGQPVIVNDNSGPNTLEVTPTGANSALLQVQGAGPVVNLSNAGSLALGFIPANNNQLVVNATPNADTINVSGASVSIVGLLAVNETGVASLTVNGLEGSDTFNVTAAAIPIHINGGDPIGVLPGDTLNILAGGNPVQYFAGPHVDEGGFVVGANAEISFQQIESIGAIINPGPVLIVGTNGDDDIQVIARDASYITSGPVPPGLDGTQDFTVSVNQGPNILFVNATQGLFIDALSGDDQVDVRAPAPNNAPWNMQVTVAGGAPAGQPGLNGDDFTFETPGAGNHVTYQPTGIDTGVFALTQTAGGADSTVINLNSFTVPAPPLAKPYVSSAGGFESLAYDGQGVNDVLAIAGTAGNDTITSTPGAANDAGTIAVNSLLALSYKNLGAGGSLTVGGNGGVDTLVVSGTAGVDSFGVNSAGTVSLNGRTPIQQLGITNLVLNGLGGDNTYSISALQPYSHTTVNGSGNSDPDVLNLAGDGSSPVSVNLGGPTQTVSGGGLGVVDITGVGIVNLSNAAGAINVLGTTGPDSLSVTPTGANTVTIQDGALAPVLNTTNTGALNIVEGTAGDGDTVTVHGTSNSDVIGVAQGATTTVQVGGWKEVNINTANVEALVVDGGLGADTFNVSGTGGPALTIAGGQTPAADTLNLATVNANVTYGADPSSGAIDTGAGVVSFADIKTINLTGNTLGLLAVNGTSGNDAINQLNNQVTVNNGAVINFVGYASLALNGLAGNDQFNVNPTTLPAGLIFNVNGGTSTSGDSLVVNGSAAQDMIGFAPTGANAGSVAIGASPAVSFTAIGNVSVNGQGGNDLFTVTTPAGADAITYTAGATVDAASVQVGSLVPMSFTNLGSTGRVTLADTSGNPVDSLLYNGTAGNDSFGVNATGIVFLNSQLQVSIPGIANLTLDGQSGVNAFSVAGNIAIPVNVNGGSASAGNSLTVLGDGNAPLTVDLGNHTVQEAGFGLISFNGLSQVNVDAAGQDVNVVGGAGDDNISYTPSGTDAGALQLAGLNTVFNLSAVGNLSVDPLGGTNSVTVNGNANQNTIDVVRGASTSVQVDSLQSISIASADTQTIVVNSGLGDDTIDVSGSGGSALAINGGSAAASDTLNVTAHGFTQVSFGGNSTSGTVATTDPQIAFSGIAVLGLTGDANSSLSVFATNGNDAINLNENVVTVNAGTNVDFINYPTLNLFGQNGDDVFNVWPTTTAGLTAINIDGGDPTASDQLIVNGSSSADTIGYNPTGADAGSVTIAGSPAVNFTTTESVVINGQGGNDALSVTTPAGADNITYAAGATTDAAAVQVGSLAPMQFKNLGAAGSVTLADTSGGRVDTLVYSGTAANDTFTVAAGGAVTLNSQLAVSTPGISNLVLNGLNGDDTFNVTAPQPFASISLAGGDPSASDVVNLTGDGSAISLAIGGSTTTVTGGGLGIVMLTSDETLNLDAAGGAVTTTDSAGPNTLDITPTGASAATLQIEGQSPVVNLTNSGTFNASFTGAGDSLVVNGTSGPDLINASGSQVAVNALLAVNYAGATALTVNGSTGADTFNVTPDATVAIHVNGGDPIGVLPGDVLNIVAGGSPVSFFAGPHSDEGGFQVGSDAAVSFQQIESIGPIIGPGPVLILGTNGDDDIQVIARDSSYNALADGVQDYTVSVNAGPNILFINSPNLYIDALSGDDEVDVRAPAPNHAVWNTQVTIAGGAPAGQPGLNGDNFTLETPGAGNQVTYQPNATDGGVFTFSSSTITLTSAPFTIPAINYTSSAGGFESATYDGQGGNAALTIVGTTGNDTITHTAGAANDAGEVAVNSLLALSYKNLGATGSILVDGNGGVDTLAVDGTANNDSFTVDGTTGTVNLNNRMAIAQTDVTNLVLNGYNPNNTFNLNASLPYESTTVNSIDPATLNLNGTPGAQAIGVDLANSQITGFGGVVNYVGVAIVNMNGNGGADSLTVNGTTNDDVITYKPTSSGGGTFSLAGMPVNFNFNIGAGNVFTVNGGGGNGGDEVDVLGNNAGSVITVDSPNRTVSVENALNVVLMPVVLGADVQVASVAGGIGNNTILVIPARNVPAGTDIVGPGFNMPNNLLVHVNGGAVPSNAALVVADTNGATLNSSLFAVVNRTSNTSGVVRLFQSTGGPEPIQYPDISYTNVGLVQASTAVNTATHQQQTLTMGPDASDPNSSLNNAAYLGSGASINATNLTIFPNAFEHRFLQAEQDWFRVVAQYTGTMDFQVYFKQYAGFLPGGGELQIQVYDAAGNQITAFGVNDTDSDQRRRIPVVAGETYYLQVYGITQDPNFTPADGFDPTNATVNAYNLSITNTPAPSPDSLGLNNIVAQGSINNAIAPTTTTFTASNAAVPPPPTQPLPPLSSIDGFYVGKYLEFTSGALIGQRQLVTAYVGATHTFTFASPFSAAPAVNDKFQIESNDTGRTQFDNVTRDNTPTIYIRLDAANTPTDGLLDLQGGGSTSQTPPNNTPILIPFWAGNAATPPNSPANNGSFRVAVYDNTNPQSPLFLGYANAVPGQQGVFQLQVTTPLSDGSHILAAKVEIDSPSAPSNKDLSSAATFQMVVDTQAPPVYFGSPTVVNSGLLGSSDTGVNGQPATIVDRITADSTPTLYGAAEANAVVRLYSDTNNNGIVDNGDVFLGLTTAAPVDGTNQFPSGQWQITTNVDLNNPTLGFSLDGVRHLLVTAEDAAGNVSAPQALTIFLDTQGPTVKNVSVTGSPGFDLFAVKANTVSPTPLVNSLDITFNDQPIRVGPSFVYPAVNPILATTPGNYVLIGEATGRVVITSVTFSDSTASGTPGMSVATLHFAAPLPDDRYTLTISDNITDNAGNNLDGEFGPTFSSGNGKVGGQFLGQFTVDSRPELGTYSSGSVAIDLNGNFIFDPQNVDQTNRDTTFAMGFSTDRLFAGKLADSHGVVNGFDKLGAYGFLNGQWRWLLDLDGDGVIDPAKGDLSVVEPLALDALPVAGNWTNSPTHADQIGLFDGKTWWLDMNGDHVIDATDIALGGELTGNMKGLPIVGDFDGDGKTDLGTFANGVFYFDLSSKDPGGKLTGNYNTTLNVQTDLPNNVGFAGVLARPVAADMNQDGITDIGLFVPGRTQNASPSTAEWYWLISNDPNGTNRITGTVNTLNHPFDPTPLGHDLYAQFGNQFALPLVGNFDPPGNGAAGGGTQSGGGNWIQNLYLDVLGRAASTDEIAYWTDQVNHGVTSSQIATLFLTSTEHRSQLINTLYQQYLGRQADQAGINYWIGIWNATGGPEAVQAGIIGSAEYYQTAGGTDAAWVTALYQNILGRTVDAQGLAYWTNYIKTHTKQSVVMGFVTSDEYRLSLINGWFQVYLGRTLDASGAQYWLNQMKLGETQEQIQAGILGSTEFRNR